MTSRITNLANYYVIWATVIVQLLVPLLHHTTLAIIVSLKVK